MRRLARPLLYAGIFGLVFGFSKYHAQYIGTYDLTASDRLGWAIGYATILCAMAYALGLPELPRSLRGRVTSALLTAAGGSAAISILQLFIGDALLPRFVVFASAITVMVWSVGIAGLAAAGRRTDASRDRVLLVGSMDLAEEIARELSSNPERDATLIRTVSESDAAGEGTPLIDAAQACQASMVVLSGPSLSTPVIIDQAAVLHERGIRVRSQLLFYEDWLGKIPIADLGRSTLFFDIGELHRQRYGRVKRFMDIAAGAVGVVVLGVVIPVVWTLNRVGNKGRLFYTQPRVGRDGEVFQIFKFRSMVDVDGAATDWTAENDPRITPIGRVLRISHLDELPQMWNIVRGDLSLVGPRPEQPRYVAELRESLPFYNLRHVVRPGLTGWAQVKYGYAGDERDTLEKLQYDFHYLQHQSMLFDLRIVARTLRSVVGGEGSGR